MLILTMVIIPYSVHGYAPFYITITATFSVLGICCKTPGVEFLLMAIALCLPSGWSGWTANSSVSFPEIDSMHRALGRFILFIIPILGLWCFNESCFPQKKRVLNLLATVIAVGVIATLITADMNEFKKVIIIIGCTYSFLFICYQDKKISLKDVFFYIDVLFAVSFIYGVLDYFFRLSPYQFISNATFSEMWINRAKGILGHPLYLSALVLFFQSTIFIRYLLYKRFTYFQEFICIIMALIVVSRTTVIVMLLEYILFIIINKGYKNIKFIVFNIMGLTIISLFFIYFADSILIDIMLRFNEGVGNRDGAWEPVMSLFVKNPIGVGYSNIMSSLSRGYYVDSEFNADFSTVDNLFLSQLAAYGVFGFFKIAYYFYFLYDAYKLRKKSPQFFKIIVLLYFPILLESFSFDWDGSIFLCLLVYGLIGYIYRFFHINSFMDSKAILPIWFPKYKRAK